jgi:hypothetical protein
MDQTQGYLSSPAPSGHSKLTVVLRDEAGQILDTVRISSAHRAACRPVGLDPHVWAAAYASSRRFGLTADQAEQAADRAAARS